MKRLVTLMLAAGLLLGGASVSTASAVELKAGGQWQFAFGWGDTKLGKNNPGDRFQAVQRIRPEFKFIADENLRAVLQLEIGKLQWGNGSAALGNDGKEVKVRYGYVDWTVPGAGTKVRMGLQQFNLPSFVGNYPVGLNDTAGIALTHQFCDNFGVSFAWMRPENDSTSKSHDGIDTFSLVFNAKGEGWKVAPWVMTAPIGKDANFTQSFEHAKWLRAGLLPINNMGAASRPDSDTAWWAGLGFELSAFDPFKVALDFAYGKADFGTDATGQDLKRSGWFLNLLATYKLDMVTPGLQFWYASGDDSNVNNGSERMPYIIADNANIAKGFGDSGFGFEQSTFGQGAMDGNWGLQLRFDNINYGVEGLSHDLRALYARGTNNKACVENYGLASYTGNMQGYYLTTKDSVWQVSLDTKYAIYKNLTAWLTLSYMKFDYDEDVWGSRSNFDDKMWAATVQMQYKF